MSDEAWRVLDNESDGGVQISPHPAPCHIKNGPKVYHVLKILSKSIQDQFFQETSENFPFFIYPVE